MPFKIFESINGTAKDAEQRSPFLTAAKHGNRTHERCTLGVQLYASKIYTLKDFLWGRIIVKVVPTPTVDSSRIEPESFISASLTI
jgi:hypothetical protein